MISFKTCLIIFCTSISVFENIRECRSLTHVASEKSIFAMCLTSQDNLFDLVDPRKVVKFIDEMNAFKIELVKTKQYYQYCANELRFELNEFVKWMEYAIEKVDMELDFAVAVTHLIQKKSEILDVVHLELTVEPLDEKIIRKALQEIRLLRDYLISSEATKCVDRLKKIHEVSESILGKHGWLRKLWCKLFRREDSEEKITRPTPPPIDSENV